MNRTEYYNYIDEKLHTLAYRITTNGKLNMLHLHMHSESFYLHFFNLLYDYNLVNLNKSIQNVEAIDLIDFDKKIVIQVSSTSTKQKIESSLDKDLIKEYSKDYSFKFISIAKDSKNLSNKIYKNPHNISFNPSCDIYDITSILNTILLADIDKQKKIYQFIKKELGSEIDPIKLESNLATVINILAKENWDEANEYDSPNPFEIEKKITFNELNSARDIIEEYSTYYGKVDKKYSELDSLGHNKSNSVLASIKRKYRKLRNKQNGDEVFEAIIEKVQEEILQSNNYVNIPIDELELCIDILVVDAFIRCKIFENPKGYNYVAT